MLGILRCEEENHETSKGEVKTAWLYCLAEKFDRATLLALADLRTKP